MLNQKSSISKAAIKPADIIIIFSACFLTVWLYSVFWFNDSLPGDAVSLQIQIADNPPENYSLDTDRVIKIEGTIGDSLIEIKQGKARFTHSPCRNKFCLFHGWLSTAGDTTACLPNRISISLKGKTSAYDAIAGGK